MIPSERVAGVRAETIAADLRAVARDTALLRGEEPRDGWQRARVDPVAVVRAAPEVEVGERWRLVAYQWYDGSDGIGAVFAVPVDDIDAAPTLHDGGRLDPPASAASSISVALSPAGSSESFLARSLLIRELQEIGAIWHGVRWGSHDLLTGPAVLPRDSGPWSWDLPAPQSFDPLVEVSDSAAVRVTFYTRSDMGGARIVEHLDVHAIRDGSVEMRQRTVARGTGGWVP